MLLVADVGNTNTKIGVFDGDRLVGSWRLTTRREQTADEYGLFIESFLRTRDLGRHDIRGIAISNVVPPLQQVLEWMAEQYFGTTAYFVVPGVNSPLPLMVDAPTEVGADRVVDAFAALRFYGAPLIVVNCGTATTFDCVNARGQFIGGAIAPGIMTASDALLTRAARLPRVELVRPKDAIGRDTITNIQSGIVYGFAGLVDGIITRMKAEMDGSPKIIGTGGLVSLVADVTTSIEHVNDDLRLEGLRILHEEATGQRS